MVKYPPASAGEVRNVGSVPGLGRSRGGGYGNPLQYSCLDNPLDRGGQHPMVHRVAKSQTWPKLYIALAIALGQEMCSHKSHNKVTVVVVNVVAFSFFILGVTVIKMCTLGENSTHLYEGYSQKLYESVMFKYHKNTRYFYFLSKLLVCNYWNHVYKIH